MAVEPDGAIRGSWIALSRVFVDSNVHVYAADPSDVIRHSLALGLIEKVVEERNGCTSPQVALETYSALVRKLAVAPAVARQHVERLRTWSVYRPRWSDVVAAMKIQADYKLSTWDAMIVRSAMRLGCSILYSEDFSDGMRFGDLVVVNPFPAGV